MDDSRLYQLHILKMDDFQLYQLHILKTGDFPLYQLHISNHNAPPKLYGLNL